MYSETSVSLQEKISFLFLRDHSCQRNGRAVGTHLAPPDPRGKGRALATGVFLPLMLQLLLLSSFCFQLLECPFLLSVELLVVSLQACRLVSPSVMA